MALAYAWLRARNLQLAQARFGCASTVVLWCLSVAIGLITQLVPRFQSYKPLIHCYYMLVPWLSHGYKPQPVISYYRISPWLQWSAHPATMVNSPNCISLRSYSSQHVRPFCFVRGCKTELTSANLA